MIDFLDMDNNKMVISEFYENDTAGNINMMQLIRGKKFGVKKKRVF